MRPERHILWIALFALVQAAPLAAQIPLRQNGAQFVAEDKRYPIRCLDQPRLLDYAPSDARRILARASAAGFNAVSFNAPLVGNNGLVDARGKIQVKVKERLVSLLDAAGKENIYLFPVLWSPSSVNALLGTVGGDQRYFWSYKTHMQWQGWLLKQLAEEAGFAKNPAVGGLLLYRGPWPGPYPEGSVGRGSPGGKARMRFVRTLSRWASWQVRVASRLGLRQPKGMGFWFLKDLPLVRKAMDMDEGDLRVDGEAPAPLPPLPGSGGELELVDDALLDVLPPVPGEEKIVDKSGKPVYEAASTQIDWEAFTSAYRSIPLSSWLDFMEVTFDTEDWHRVADKLSGVSREDLEVPLLWRHDWRASSSYERSKRLEVEGLAGLSGPWPGDAWPGSGEAIWQPLALDSDSGRNMALDFKELKFEKNAGTWELTCRTNRPSTVHAHWGDKLPLDHRMSRQDKSLVHRVQLEGAREGDKVLLTIRADSDRWGRAVLRTRWVQVARRRGEKN